MTKKKCSHNPKPQMTRDRLVRKFITLSKKLKKLVNQTDLSNAGIPRHMVRYHFGNVTELKKYVMNNHSGEMLGICDLNLLAQHYKVGNMSPSLKGYKRFVITSAVTGNCAIHSGFYKTLKSYCRKNDACLLVVPCWDRADSHLIDKRIWNDMRSTDYVKVILGAVKLNDKLTLNLAKVPPRQIDPTSGFGDFVHSYGSQIVASPKLKAIPHPTQKGRMPHYIFTTGALTLPNYYYKSPSEMRRAIKSEENHFIAALVVEVRNDKVYHQRHVEANPDGSFTDLAIMYTPDGRTRQVQAEAVTLGDLHLDEVDEKALSITLKACSELGAKDIYIHDGMDGGSHNRHERKSYIKRAIKQRDSNLDIRMEFDRYCKFTDKLSKSFNVYDVFSNHSPEWIYKYLDEVDYRKDPVNYEVCNELTKMIFDGSTHLVESYFRKKYPKNNKVRFLRMDESVKYVDTEMGSHGHVGNSGSRGTLKALKAVYRKSTSGHTHVYARDGNAMSAGTLSILDPEYCRGGGSWTHCSILHYPDGSRQPLMLIDGKWRL